MSEEESKFSEAVRICKKTAKSGYARVGRILEKVGLDQEDKTLIRRISSIVISRNKFIREEIINEAGVTVDYNIYENPNSSFLTIQQICMIGAILISITSLIATCRNNKSVGYNLKIQETTKDTLTFQVIKTR